MTRPVAIGTESTSTHADHSRVVADRQEQETQFTDFSVTTRPPHANDGVLSHNRPADHWTVRAAFLLPRSLKAVLPAIEWDDGVSARRAHTRAPDEERPLSHISLPDFDLRVTPD
jgi:hypothetical protein